MYKIVLIDDEPWVLLYMKKVFQREDLGYRVVAAESSSGAALRMIVMYHYLKDDAELNQVLAYNRSYFEGEEQVPSFRVIYNEEKTISYIVYVQPVKFLSRATTRWKEQIGCLLIFLDDVLINDILTERDTDIISGVYLLDSQDMIVNGVGEQICETKQEELEIQPIAETDRKSTRLNSSH